MTSQLNPCQEKAAEEIFAFLFSPEKEFNVSGPAGVGKTFLMNHIMKDALPTYENTCKLLGIDPINFEIELTATTNKATEVLSNATGFPARTIHSFLNLKVVDDYETGVSKITRTGAWTVHSRKLIFIDEASMIDAELHKYILMGTDSSCKVIYLGDRCQMAPVFEKISPVYHNPKHLVELRTQMRNAGQPALSALCDQLRENVDTLSFKPIQEVPGVIDYLDDARAKSFIDSTFAAETNSSRVLCYTNSKVGEYNEYIRNLRGYPELFVEGERVINNAAIEISPKLMLKVEQQFTISDVRSTPYTKEVEPGVELLVYDVSLTGSGQYSLPVTLAAEPSHLKDLMRYYASQKNWKLYYRLKNAYPDLRPRDAATVYKAQGSTYESVFLDLGNIGACKHDDQVARMLYVGASRATTRLVLYGQLPARFHGRTAASQGALV